MASANQTAAAAAAGCSDSEFTHIEDVSVVSLVGVVVLKIEDCYHCQSSPRSRRTHADALRPWGVSNTTSEAFLFPAVATKRVWRTGACVCPFSFLTPFQGGRHLLCGGDFPRQREGGCQRRERCFASMAQNKSRRHRFRSHHFFSSSVPALLLDRGERRVGISRQGVWYLACYWVPRCTSK